MPVSDGENTVTSCDVVVTFVSRGEVIAPPTFGDSGPIADNDEMMPD